MNTSDNILSAVLSELPSIVFFGVIFTVTLIV